MLHPSLRRLCVLAVPALLAGAPAAVAQTFLTANGTSDTYSLINSVLGGNAIESPDCSHTSFGPHITQAFDSTLNKSVFVFHSHVTPDNDRCSNFDRQRIEIKTHGPSPSYVKAFRNEVTTYRWRFKLDAGFQPSPNFTHIHQIKAGDGDSGAPIMTITPRAGNPQLLQLIHTDSNGDGTTLSTSPLSNYKGVWVEAYERMTHDFSGTYSLQIRRLDNNQLLWNYSNNDIDMWRDGTTFSRPKWGVYRSLNSASQLRDEQVRFDRFCLAKGSDDCPAGSGPGPGPSGVSFEADAIPRTVSGATAASQNDANATNGTWLALLADGVSDYIEYTLSSVPAGTYSLRMTYKAHPNRGILQASLDGANIGSQLDQYSASPGFQTVTFGTVTFGSTGNHTLRLTTTGRNGSAGAFTLSADVISLVP